MNNTVRLFLLFEGIAFVAASLTHLGVLIHGHEHRPAGMAEGGIGIVLLIGFLFTWIVRAWTRGRLVVTSRPSELASDLADRNRRRPSEHKPISGSTSPHEIQ